MADWLICVATMINSYQEQQQQQQQLLTSVSVLLLNVNLIPFEVRKLKILKVIEDVFT